MSQAAPQSRPAPEAQPKPSATKAPAEAQTAAKAEPVEKKTWMPLVVQMSESAAMRPNEYWQTVKATCGLATAADTAVIAFLLTAKKYDLDPIVRQIYAFEKNGKIVPIVPIDGWLKIINDHPAFEGMEFTDNFNEEDPTKIEAITCKIWRKDRKVPTEVTEYLSECMVESSQPWKRWPIRMLRHKATIQCGRYAFALGGIYDPDEGERIKEARTPEEIAAAVDAHIQDTDTGFGETPQDAEFSEVVSEVEKQANEKAVAEPPSDWDAIYDELSPGVTNTHNAQQLASFFGENEEMIEKMSKFAPRKIVEKWMQLVDVQRKGFAKKAEA